MFLLPEKTVRLHVGFRGVGGTLLDRWYHRFHVSHTETVSKNVCYILNIRSSKNTGLQTQVMISDKKLSLFHPVLSKLSVFVFRYRLRNSSSPSISRYINKIYFRVYLIWHVLTLFWHVLTVFDIFDIFLTDRQTDIQNLDVEAPARSLKIKIFLLCFWGHQGTPKLFEAIGSL